MTCSFTLSREGKEELQEGPAPHNAFSTFKSLNKYLMKRFILLIRFYTSGNIPFLYIVLCVLENNVKKFRKTL
jgi:hypothetical protein